MRTVKGADLVGKRYHRLFDYLEAEGDICRVLRRTSSVPRTAPASCTSPPPMAWMTLSSASAHGLPVVHGVGLDGYFCPR
jgi:hypothetical protein